MLLRLVVVLGLFAFESTYAGACKNSLEKSGWLGWGPKIVHGSDGETYSEEEGYVIKTRRTNLRDFFFNGSDSRVTVVNVFDQSGRRVKTYEIPPEELNSP